MLNRMMIVGILGAGLIFSAPGGKGPRRGGGNPEALKQALNLTDTQVQQIRDLTRQQMESVKPLAEQMREKGTALREEMKKSTPDQARVGQLTVDIKSLREQMKSKRAARGDSISALLTAEQREKLKTLEEAAKLGPAVRQAAALGLIDLDLSPESERALGRAMRMRGRGMGREF
jgi:Spy/CpxP family protein refolding chaperone